VLSFVFYWSDFIGPLLYLHDPRNYTLPIALQALQQLDPTIRPPGRC
jgi:multiple sugar transport system permease protein